MEHRSTAEYRNNTHENPLEWGIFKFAKEFFPETFTHPFAGIHGEVAEIWAELYSPDRVNRNERKAYVVVFRESAKTTISTFLIPIYCIMMKGKMIAFRNREGRIFKHLMDEKLIMIASETSGMSETFVMNLRSVIESHKDLAALFGNKHPKAVQLDEDPDIVGENRIWRQNAFTTSDDTTIWGVGAGQQVRGKQVKRMRPTLIIGDDIYSENNVKTEERRAGINKWWFASLGNSLDSQKGKIVFLGTILHEDTVPRVIQRSDQWFGIERKIISLEELQTVIDTHCSFTPDGRFIHPDKSKCGQIQKGLKSLAWPDRHDLYYILGLYKDSFDQGKVAYFYQEYLSITNPPEEIKYDRDRFRFVKMEIVTKRNRPPQLKWEYENQTHFMPLASTIAIDIATSEKKKADETVVTCIQHGDITRYKPGHADTELISAPVILDMMGGRGWAINREYKDGRMIREGQATIIREWRRKYHASMVVIEVNGQQELVFKEIRRQMMENREPARLIQETAGKEQKADRINAILEPFFADQRTDIIFVDARLRPQFEKMWAQLINLGNDDHDDWPDSLSMAFKYARPLRQHQDPSVLFDDEERRRMMYPPRQSLQEDSGGLDWETV